MLEIWRLRLTKSAGAKLSSVIRKLLTGEEKSVWLIFNVLPVRQRSPETEMRLLLRFAVQNFDYFMLCLYLNQQMVHGRQMVQAQLHK